MELFKITLSAIVAAIMFIGGIILLFSNVPFWSLVLGIPATQIGIIFLIFSYERLSRESTFASLEGKMKKNRFDQA
jgi:hypothetical protein